MYSLSSLHLRRCFILLLCFLCPSFTIAKAGPDDWLVPWEESIHLVGVTYPEHATYGFDGEKFAMDFANPEGCRLYAPCDGTVFMYNFEGSGITNHWMSGYGNYIMFRPSDFNAYVVMAHFDSLDEALVRRFSRGVFSITAGEYIGYMGNTGNSTGTHLHFEITLLREEIQSVFGHSVLSLMVTGINGGIPDPPTEAEDEAEHEEVAAE